MMKNSRSQGENTSASSALPFGKLHDDEDQDDEDEPDDEEIGRKDVLEDGKDRPGEEERAEREDEEPDVPSHIPCYEITPVYRLWI